MRKFILTERQLSEIIISEGAISTATLKVVVAGLRLSVSAITRMGIKPNSPIAKFIIKPILSRYLKSARNWTQLFKMVGKKVGIRTALKTPKGAISDTNQNIYQGSLAKATNTAYNRNTSQQTAYAQNPVQAQQTVATKGQLNEFVISTVAVGTVITVVEAILAVITKFGLPKILADKNKTSYIYNLFTNQDISVKYALSFILPGEAVCQVVQSAIKFGFTTKDSEDAKNFAVGIYDLLAMVTNQGWISNGDFSPEELNNMVLAYDKADPTFIDKELNNNVYYVQYIKSGKV